VITSPPRITGFSPDRGTVGTAIAIDGAGFGTNPALVEVTVADRRMEIRSLTDSRIEAIIPAGAPSGRIRVVVRLQGNATSDRELLVLGDFALTSLEPATGHPGMAVTIRGTGFSATGLTVSFTGERTPVPYSLVSPSEIRTIVPAGARTGPLTVRTADGRELSLAFTASTAPTGLGILAVEPQCLRPGCRVIVRGYGFSRAPGQNQITVGTTRVRPIVSTAYQLQFDLPATPGTMTIRIEVRRRGSVESPPITITP
jgi:hypothetical protein